MFVCAAVSVVLLSAIAKFSDVLPTSSAENAPELGPNVPPVAAVETDSRTAVPKVVPSPSAGPLLLRKTRAMRFLQTPDRSSVQFASLGGVSSLPPGILSEFDLVTAEDRVTVKDADGSVYVGRISSTDGEAFAFRVSGQNRVTRQQVDFDGRYSPSKRSVDGELRLNGRPETKLDATATNPRSHFHSIAEKLQRARSGITAKIPTLSGSTAKQIALGYQGLRHTYLKPKLPAAGSRTEARPHFEEGRRLQRLNRWSEAAAAYRKAIEADGTYFEACHNLAIAAGKQNEFKSASEAFETALVVRPTSVIARYNFATLLHLKGYHRDAAIQLLTVVQQDTANVPAHLLLADICDGYLAERGLARKHYSRVLDLDPAHRESTAIGYWLAAN